MRVLSDSGGRELKMVVLRERRRIAGLSSFNSVQNTKFVMIFSIGHSIFELIKL
jgi:hypothetical protein